MTIFDLEQVESEKNLESLLEWCKEGSKTVYYRRKDGGEVVI